MRQESALSLFELAKELQLGTATTKYLLHRFSPWIIQEQRDEKIVYPRDTVTLLLSIKSDLDQGVLPTEIEARLEHHPLTTQPHAPAEVSPALTEILSGIQSMNQQQERLATAQEARNHIEERKAQALEQRAQAEALKAQAMVQAAAALERLAENPMAAPTGLVHDTVEMLSDPQAEEPFPSHQADDFQESTQGEEIPEMVTPVDLDDLSQLIDEVSESQEKAPAPEPATDLDDLSALIDPVPEEEEQPDDTAAPDVELDDLSLLVDPEPEIKEAALDDLYDLIDTPATEDIVNDDTDDLWALTEEEGQDDPVELDLPEETDDLYALVDDSIPEASLKPEISPQEDFGKYKAAIMQIIIELKNSGLTAQETTKRLNKEEIQTLSGKPQWSAGAISKIYSFIDAAG